MISLTKAKRLYVYYGKFNVDEILSISLIKKINESIEIIRIEKNKIINDENGFILNKSDLHTSNSKRNKFNEKISTFSNIWNKYYKILLKKNGFKKINDAKNLFNRFYASRINIYINNGLQKMNNNFPEIFIINDFNTYEEEKDNTFKDLQFYKALGFANTVMDNWFRNVYQKVELAELEDEIWLSASSSSEDGIFILDENIPWQSQQKKNEDIKADIIICKDTRGDGYSIKTDFVHTIPSEEEKNLTFLHPSKFMAVAANLSKAIEVAKNTVFSYQ